MSTAPQVTTHKPMRTREGCKVEQTDSYNPLNGNTIANITLSTSIDFEAVDGLPYPATNHHSSRDFARGEAD